MGERQTWLELLKASASMVGGAPQALLERVGVFLEAHIVQPRAKDTRESAHKRGYGRQWRSRRDAFLARSENQLCAPCKERNLIHGAELVHHTDHDPRNNARGNLQAVCRDWHERHHGRKH